MITGTDFLNALMAMRRIETPVDEPPRACPEFRSDIPVLANRFASAPPSSGEPRALGSLARNGDL